MRRKDIRSGNIIEFDPSLKKKLFPKSVEGLTVSKPIGLVEFERFGFVFKKRFPEKKYGDFAQRLGNQFEGFFSTTENILKSARLKMIETKPKRFSFVSRISSDLRYAHVRAVTEVALAESLLKIPKYFKKIETIAVDFERNSDVVSANKIVKAELRELLKNLFEEVDSVVYSYLESKFSFFENEWVVFEKIGVKMPDQFIFADFVEKIENSLRDPIMRSFSRNRLTNDVFYRVLNNFLFAVANEYNEDFKLGKQIVPLNTLVM